ncbi:hypothetical protein [Micromonospora inyonensis]|uniref:Uncharacterized protein n=1 Tax=Micromonospora inyonensis TaxID=47866 RepID=A0A1C6RD44_9ACTN|nr:hypothetical protein [Micromonospora inyonensis]SCL15073.1 hypothetical protein GA0074694_1041 [Micromonospora inyonensis]
MSLTREQAAQALGMKTREVVDVVRDGDGYVVTTHDGQRTPVARTGEVARRSRVNGNDRTTPAAGTPVTPTPTPPPAGPDSAGAVPDGSAAEVMTWVGVDVDRAIVALAVEEARDKPRSGLVGDLQKVVRSGSGE